MVVAVSPPLFGAAAALLVARRMRVPFGLIVQDIYSAGVQELALDKGLGSARRGLDRVVEQYVVTGLRISRRSTSVLRPDSGALSRRKDPDITIIRNWTHLPGWFPVAGAAARAARMGRSAHPPSRGEHG